MKQFRLLRSNKETGPYSAEQLIQLGLKAYDLVWEDGRSAAWRYPSEISELKAFAPSVEEQPFDRFYKRKEENVYDVTEKIIAPEKKEKPRIRIKADWKKIEEPLLVAEKKETQQPVFIKQNISAETQPSWQDAWLDWEQEKKAVTSTNKNTSYNYINTKDNVPFETKFSQSLNDIKERYVESILKPREKNSLPLGAIFQRKNIVAVVLIGLVVWGMYVGFVMKDPATKNIVAAAKPASVKVPPTVVIPPDVSDNTDAASQPVNNDNVNNTGENVVVDNKVDRAENKNNLPKPAESKIVATTITPEQAIIPQKKNHFQKSIVKQNISLVYKQHLIPGKNIAVKNNQSAKILSTLPPAGHSIVVQQQNNGQYTRTVARRIDNDITSNPQPSILTAKNTNSASPFSSKKRIEDYVTVNNPNGSFSAVQNMHLSLQNVTDSPIDLAVVDIQYYDVNGRFQKGETVYVNDIPANENVDVKVPDSRNSSHINYKVSLVSAAQKTLVAD
jgi:hypothetical protein